MREKMPKAESASKLFKSKIIYIQQNYSKTTRLAAEDIREKSDGAIQTKVELLQNVIEPLLDFLQEKTAADREIKQQKLGAKQQEQESQQQMMKAL